MNCYICGARSNSWLSNDGPEGVPGPRPLCFGGGLMRGSWRLVVAIGFVGMLLAGSGSVEAFIDDMEEDFWLPFTHSISGIAPRLDTPRDSGGPGRVPFTWTSGAGR